MFPEHRNFALMPVCLLGQTGTAVGRGCRVLPAPTGLLMAGGHGFPEAPHSPGALLGRLTVLGLPEVAGIREFTLHKSAGLPRGEEGRGCIIAQGFSLQRVKVGVHLAL